MNDRIVHGGCGLAEIARIGLDNQILHEISYLRHTRQPAMHNPGLDALIMPLCQASLCKR
jgi:hypothetical protein